MKYIDQYIELQDYLWTAFEKLVQKGAKFPELIEVTFPYKTTSLGIEQETGGESWFLAQEIIANPTYKLHKVDDFLFSVQPVTFIDFEGNHHTLEPDHTNMLWLAQILDGEV